MNKYILIITIAIGFCYSCKNNEQCYKIQKGNVIYDFSFAELAIKYLESNDSSYLRKISELEALEHLLNHAKQFNYSVPKKSEFALAKFLLNPIDKKKAMLPDFKRNLKYAKQHVAETDIAQMVVSQFLPDNLSFTSTLFFTFGYDLGVAYGNNASLNLAHSYYIENIEEIKYYSIHELHHAGFICLRDNKMPSINITTYREMAELIEYLTHLEGMGTYVPYDLRKNESALNIDEDYIALQNPTLMREYEKEFFDIYFHFKLEPEKRIIEDDWEKISILSDKKRLWYRVGAKISQAIDNKQGRGRLIGLISEPSENFITTYLKIKEE